MPLKILVLLITGLYSDKIEPYYLVSVIIEHICILY